MQSNQKTYTAHFDYLTSEQIQALQEVGAIDFVFTVEAEDRHKLVRELAEAYEWRYLGDENAWQQRLSRGKHLA